MSPDVRNSGKTTRRQTEVRWQVMATPSRDNSPQRAPLLIRRSLTTVIRKGFCYSIELHVVAQQGRCPAVGKFPLQRAVDPTNSVDLPSKHPAQRNDRRSAKRRRRDIDETNCAKADQCLEGKCRPPVEAQAAPNSSKRAKILEDDPAVGRGHSIRDCSHHRLASP
jgi:hypothetical protein